MLEGLKVIPQMGIPIWISNEEYQNSRCTIFDKEFVGKYGVARFEKRFCLNKKTREMTVWATGCTKYRLYVDEQWIGKGPAIPGGDYENKKPPKEWYYDQFSLSLTEGKHLIRAEVCLTPEVMAEYSIGRGAFLLVAEVIYEDGEKEYLFTDESWECGLDERYEQTGQYNGKKSVSLEQAKRVEPG